jgi:hypothetical protein
MTLLLQECVIGPCATKAYNGLWEIPLTDWDNDQRRCSSHSYFTRAMPCLILSHPVTSCCQRTQEHATPAFPHDMFHRIDGLFAMLDEYVPVDRADALKYLRRNFQRHQQNRAPFPLYLHYCKQ